MKSPTRTRPKRSQTINQPSPTKLKEYSQMDIYYTDNDLNANNTHQCRICLQGKTQSKKMITPCKCTGSVQFAHEQCIRQWIEKLLIVKNGNSDAICCELCKENFVYEIENKRSCDEWAIVKLKICLNPKIFGFLLFLFLLTLGITIYLISLFAKIIDMSRLDPKFIQIGVISFSIVLLLVTCSLLTVIMIRQFVYSERRQVSTVMSMMNKCRKMSYLTDMSYSPRLKPKSKSKIMPFAPMIEDFQ